MPQPDLSASTAHKERGTELFKAGDSEAAESECAAHSHSQRAPSDATPSDDCAGCCCRGRYAAAIAALGPSELAWPAAETLALTCHSNRAMCCLKLGRAAEALAQCDAGLALPGVVRAATLHAKLLARKAQAYLEGQPAQGELAAQTLAGARARGLMSRGGGGMRAKFNELVSAPAPLPSSHTQGPYARTHAPCAPLMALFPCTVVCVRAGGRVSGWARMHVRPCPVRAACGARCSAWVCGGGGGGGCGWRRLVTQVAALPAETPLPPPTALPQGCPGHMPLKLAIAQMISSLKLGEMSADELVQFFGGLLRDGIMEPQHVTSLEPDDGASLPWALCYALCECGGDATAFSRLLRVFVGHFGTPIDMRMDGGRTALMFAAASHRAGESSGEWRDFWPVPTALALGANPALRDEQGWTALMACCKLLERRGAGAGSLPAPHGMGPDGTDEARMASLEALLAAGAAPLRPFWRPF
jgi:hypothetical protein